MPQQKGMKRAVKVETRQRKKEAQSRKASLRRIERAEELAEKEADKASSSKK